jgi:hypothetical protein
LPLTSSMDVTRIDLLLGFVLAAAGEEEFDNRELGPIHLIKYAYIGDLAYAESHGGRTFTGAAWRFYHFGPWSEDVFGRIEPVANHLGATRRTFASNKFETDRIRYSFTDEQILEELDKQIPAEVARAIRHAIRRFGSDTSELLHYVYTTSPMLRAAPGEPLEFARASDKSENEVSEEGAASEHEIVRSGEGVRAGTALKSKTREKRELEALRERVRVRLKKAKEHKGTTTAPPPRYDEIFFEGVKWLDDLAGADTEASRGEAVFSSNIWKSRGRRDPGVP